MTERVSSGNANKLAADTAAIFTMRLVKGQVAIGLPFTGYQVTLVEIARKRGFKSNYFRIVLA